jgi:hypothetical protein
MSHGGSYSTGGDRLAKLAAKGRLTAFVSNELGSRTVEPIKFRWCVGDARLPQTQCRRVSVDRALDRRGLPRELGLSDLKKVNLPGSSSFTG